jgi:hypothetical protein
MRARLVPLLAVAAATLTIPAASGAAILPHCSTRLVNAAAGTTAACSTLGPEPLGNRSVGVYRTMRIEVVNGAVNATLACDNQTPQTRYVTAVLPAEISRWGGNSCTATIVAAVDGTTAVVTSSYSYVITLDQA